MARVNLTLDEETYSLLSRYAKGARAPRAALAGALVREGLQRRELAARRKKMAVDYARDRLDARSLLEELESAQLEPWSQE